MTGSFRAVKVVRREDFERERTFEREFEGIQRYEKVSQDHPGLVDVLHAGRNDREGYYYYVMELADDVETGSEIDVDRYTPRTLSSDLRQHRLRSVRECIEVGALLAEALGHLHAAGLTHRDVKPSNVIFVKGVAKLADVGLVATSGQRTFVGTEGYVPPEGPGTALADLYSLAMVLYEMGTGKDRLEFPELPTNLELPPTVNRDEWRALNAVICRAGAPDPRRRFENGAALAAALRRIVEPQGETSAGWRRHLSRAAVVLVAALAGATAVAIYRKPTGNESSPLLSGVLSDLQPEPTKGDSNPVTPPPPLNPNAGKDSEPAGDLLSLPDAFSLAGNSSAMPPETVGGSVNSRTEAGKGVVFTDPASQTGKAKAEPATPPPPPMPDTAWLRITQPSGATVWHQGKQISVTPTDYLEFPAGAVELVVKAPGYYDYTLKRDLPRGRREVESEILMIPDRSPAEGEPWVSSVGMAFRPLGRYHISEDPVSVEIFDLFVAELGQSPFSSAVPASARTEANAGQALADPSAMWAFCDWLTERDRAGGHLRPDQFHHPQPDNDSDPFQPFFSRVDSRFGSLQINSEPPGASVVLGSTELGRTPLAVEKQRIGQVRLTVKLPGYRQAPVDLEVRPSELTAHVATLSRDDSVLFGEPWQNSLGMSFVPVGDFMASVFETRRSDYDAFLASQPEGILPPAPGFQQGPDHPVAGVNLVEAKAFCDWLTKKEQAAGLLQPYHAYRIPTDRQWSALSGLVDEAGATPDERDRLKMPGQYPWGADWPPPAGSGNFGDATAEARGTLRGGGIPGYDDGFELTAPVGSFRPNPYEIHDLAGNVWEWVDEPFSGPGSGLVPARGGSWSSFQASNLLTAFRNPLSPQFKRGGAGEYGFRCVIVDTRKPGAGVP